MNVDSINNGIVIDHIAPGKAMTLYKLLGLDRLDCQIAIIKNAPSRAMGKKDIIKIDTSMDIDLDVIGYVSPNVTVNIIEDGAITEKKHIELPDRLVNIIRCKNPRCITTTEQEIDHIFVLSSREKREYRCLYCDAKADGGSSAPVC